MQFEKSVQILIPKAKDTRFHKVKY